MGKSGGGRNGGQGFVGDTGVGDVEMGELGEAWEEGVEGRAGEGEAFVETEAFNADRLLRRLLEAVDDRGEGVHEWERGRGAKVDCSKLRKIEEQFVKYSLVDVIVKVLLQKNLLDCGRELKALQERLGSKVLDLGVGLPGTPESNGCEVREVQPSDKRAQAGVLGYVVEKFGEDRGMRDRDVLV